MPVSTDGPAEFSQAPDATLAKALLKEAAALFLTGEPDTARLILRDLVNATIGFEALAELTHKPSKSLHRMLSQRGNPSEAAVSKPAELRYKGDLRRRILANDRWPSSKSCCSCVQVRPINRRPLSAYGLNRSRGTRSGQTEDVR